MEHINSYVFSALGKSIGMLTERIKQPVEAYFNEVVTIDALLKLLLRGDLKFKLDESSSAAQRFLDVISKIGEAHNAQKESALANELIAAVQFAINTFDQALALELGRAPIFLVTPKGVYDTRRLMVDASSMYEGYRDRLPEDAINDTNQAGRCLAFALPTAAGFHIARATEAVIKKQMAVFQCPPVKDGERNWGKYTELLDNAGGNPKLIQCLTRLRKLHRNPLIHPEVTLIMPEAIALWAMCTSAIQSMVADMETKMTSPSPEIVGMIPKD